MGDLKIVRVQLIDPSTGNLKEDVDVSSSAKAIKFTDGQTLQQKFDSGFIKGNPGIKGDKGDQGAKGDKGDQGAKGDTGAQGPKGLDGAKGATGEKGPKGDTGSQGPKGDQGPKGVSVVMKGIWTTGVSYVNNNVDIDIVSFNGSSYACIKSNTASADNKPPNPTYWICIASKGDTGAQGPKGLDGAKGATGEKGLKGDKGDQGPKGLDGANVRIGKDYNTGTEVKIFLKEV